MLSLPLPLYFLLVFGLEYIACSQVQVPAGEVQVGIADFYAGEQFRKLLEQALFKGIVKLASTQGESIKERVKNGLGQNIKIRFKENSVVLLVSDR